MNIFFIFDSEINFFMKSEIDNHVLILDLYTNKSNIYNNYVLYCSHIKSNRCGVSINTLRWTIAFSAGFVFITIPTGWIVKEPLIYFHSFFLSDPVSLVSLRFGYYYYYNYFQVKYTNVYVRVHTDCAPMTDGCHRGKKNYDFFVYPSDNKSIVILRPNDFFISAKFKTTIIPNCY